MIPDAAALPAAALAADWPRQLAGRLQSHPDHVPEHWRLGGEPVPAGWWQQMPPPAWQAAAVLIPIVMRPPGAVLLLTVRADHLRRHAGQISFPGGRSDAADADLGATAIREAEEEIGLARHFVRPLGYLSDHLVLTGFRITPLVGCVAPGFSLRLAAAEVSEVFELPLAVVLDAGSYQRRTRLLRGRSVEGHELQHQGHRIWGATAGMLRHLREVWLGETA